MMEQQKLVDAALEDLHTALAAARRLLATLASREHPDQSPQTAQQLQQTYLHHTGELRKKIVSLLERRSGARPAQEQQGQLPEDELRIAELQTRKQQLIHQVSAASELEAELMVQLRALLDSFQLWEAHKRHLEAPQTHSHR